MRLREKKAFTKEGKAPLFLCEEGKKAPHRKRA